MKFKKIESCARKDTFGRIFSRARSTVHPCWIVIPLSPNWRLDGKGTGIRVIPEPNAGRCSFEIVKTAAEQSAGTVNGAIATCPHCGATTPKGYIAAEAQQGRLGHQLYCVILNDQWQGFTKAGQPKKNASLPSVASAAPLQTDDASIQMAEYRLAELAPAWDDGDVLPNEAVPDGNDQRPHTYGMERWVKMFNPRQQLAHGCCVQAFRECVDDDDARRDGWMTSRRAAWSVRRRSRMDKANQYRNSVLCRFGITKRQQSGPGPF